MNKTANCHVSQYRLALELLDELSSTHFMESCKIAITLETLLGKLPFTAEAAALLQKGATESCKIAIRKIIADMDRAGVSGGSFPLPRGKR